MKDEVRDLASEFLASIKNFEEPMSKEDRESAIYSIAEALADTLACILVDRYEPRSVEIHMGLFLSDALRCLRIRQKTVE